MILHIDGYPFLVDPGTYSYHTHTEWRQYFVSTLAHNTVTINQADQAKWAGPTLWKNHYQPSLLNASSTPEFDCVSPPTTVPQNQISHTRTVEFNKKKEYLKITDQIDARKPGFMVNIPFHLHPEVFVLQTADNTYILGRKETPPRWSSPLIPLIDSMPIQASDDDTPGLVLAFVHEKGKIRRDYGENTSPMQNH